jgi:hypothetical protein
MNPPLQDQKKKSNFNQNPLQKLKFMQIQILKSVPLLKNQSVNRDLQNQNPLGQNIPNLSKPIQYFNNKTEPQVPR